MVHSLLHNTNNINNNSRRQHLIFDWSDAIQDTLPGRYTRVTFSRAGQFKVCCCTYYLLYNEQITMMYLWVKNIDRSRFSV